MSVNSTKALFFGLTILFLIIHIKCLHFDLKANDEGRCFVEELEDDVTMRGSYNVTNHGQNAEVLAGTMNLEVIDPEQKKVLSKHYGGEGTFAFNSDVPGMYDMCFSRVPGSSIEIVRIHMHYEENVKGDDSRESREDEGEKEPPMASAVNHLIEKYHKVEENLKKSKKREKRFRELSKTTNSRVLWWGFFQILVLGGTAFWQMRHLTKFFIHKKLA